MRIGIWLVYKSHWKNTTTKITVYEALYKNFGIWAVYKPKKAVWSRIPTFFLPCLCAPSFVKVKCWNTKIINIFTNIIWHISSIWIILTCKSCAAFEWQDHLVACLVISYVCYNADFDKVVTRSWMTVSQKKRFSRFGQCLKFQQNVINMSLKLTTKYTIMDHLEAELTVLKGKQSEKYEQK